MSVSARAKLSTVTFSDAKLEIEIKRIIPAAARVSRFRFIVCLLNGLYEEGHPKHRCPTFEISTILAYIVEPDNLQEYN
jgi:hypothetical protein